MLWAYLAKKDPPSDDYETVVQPVPVDSAVQTPSDPAARLGYEALVATKWQYAYVLAWLASYERYQGAEAASNRAGMSRQADAMLRYSRLAMNAERLAAAKLAELQSTIPTQAWQAVNEFTARYSSEELVRIYRSEFAATGGVPPELRTALLEYGVAESDIEDLGRDLLALTPEMVDASRPKRPDVGGMETTEDVTESALTMPYLESMSQVLVYRSRRNELKPARQERSSIDAHPSFLGALARRASFTCLHRGATACSPDMPVGSFSGNVTMWYGGKAVPATWQQKSGEIVYAGFNYEGKILSAPRLIGKGSSPRITIHDETVALVWAAESDSLVRIGKAHQWSEPIELSGGEAAIAFAPGGPLLRSHLDGSLEAR